MDNVTTTGGTCRARGLAGRLVGVAMSVLMAFSLAAAAPGVALGAEEYDVTAPGPDIITSIQQTLKRQGVKLDNWGLKTATGATGDVSGGSTVHNETGLSLTGQWISSASWAESSWEEIAGLLEAHYAGEIDLTDADNYPGFKVGTTRAITIGSISEGSGVPKENTTVVGATYHLRIVDTNTYETSSASGSTTGTRDRAAFTLMCDETLPGTMWFNATAKTTTDSDAGKWVTGGYSGSDVRAWLDNEVYGAVEQGLRSLLKPCVLYTEDGGPQTFSGFTHHTDYVFAPSVRELVTTPSFTYASSNVSETRFAVYDTDRDALSKRKNLHDNSWERVCADCAPEAGTSLIYQSVDWSEQRFVKGVDYLTRSTASAPYGDADTLLQIDETGKTAKTKASANEGPYSHVRPVMAI